MRSRSGSNGKIGRSRSHNIRNKEFHHDPADQIIVATAQIYTSILANPVRLEANKVRINSLMLKQCSLGLIGSLLLGTIGMEARLANAHSQPFKPMAISPRLSIQPDIRLLLSIPPKSSTRIAQNRRLEEAEKLHLEGIELAEQGTLESLQMALEKFETAISLFQSEGDRSGEAQSRGWVGSVYDLLDFKSEALTYLKQTLPIWQELSQESMGEERQYFQSWQVNTLLHIGKIYSDLRKTQEALNYYQQYLPFARMIDDRNKEEIAINNIGKVHKDLGNKR